MGKFNHISNNFKAGEFSPRMAARTEVEEYRSSVEKLLNIVPTKQGAGNKRTGSKYVTSLSDSEDLVRNIPFIFSKTESYVITLDTLSLTDQVGRIANFADYIQDGDEIEDSTGVGGLPYTVSRYYSVPASDFITVTKNDGSSSTITGELGHVFDGLGKPSSEITAENAYFYDPYPREIYNIIDADPRGFQFAQSGDILILTHSSGEIPPLVIARTGEDNFFISWHYKFRLRSFDEFGATRKYYSPILRSPLLSPNITPVTISGTFIETHRYSGDPQVGNTDGEVNLYDVFTLTASQDPDEAFDFFSAADLGKTIVVQVLDTGATGDDPVLQDIDFTIVDVPRSGTSTTATAITSRFVSGDLNNTVTNSTSKAFSFPATDNWRESAWGNGRGYPRSVCFYEQRLIFGGSLADVDTTWGSQTGDIFKFLANKFVQDSALDYTGLNNFIPSNIPEKDKVVDIFGNVQLQTDPLSFKPSTQEINAIQWLSGGQSLMVGTLGAEYIVSPSQALSSTSIDYRRQTSRGGSPIMPVRIDDEVVYVLRDGRSVNNFKFNRNNGSYLSEDVTSHADHIVDVGDETTVSQFVQMEYCTSRDLVLAVTDDDYLLGFTYSPQNQTMAWHRYDFQGKVLSVCCIPSENGDIDEIWLTVLRNGKRTLEKVGLDFLGTSINDVDHPALFLDCYVSRISLLAPETIDMSHLEGSTVKVYVDGFFSFEQELSSGNTDVELPICDTAIIGLPYSAIIETNDLNAGGDFGSPIGNIQRVDRVTGIYYKSMKVKVGKTGGKFFDPVPNMQESIVSGNRNIDFPAGSSEDGARIRFLSEDAFPMTVLGLVSRGITSDR